MSSHVGTTVFSSHQQYRLCYLWRHLCPFHLPLEHAWQREDVRKTSPSTDCSRCLLGLTLFFSQALGLHKDQSLYYCIALAMVWEGLFSAIYHVCPSKLNFQVGESSLTKLFCSQLSLLILILLRVQFDTSFMLIGTGLMFIAVFQKRHPTTAPGAVRVFVFFALLILISFLALTDIPVAMCG